MTAENKLNEMEDVIKEVSKKVDEVLYCLKGGGLSGIGLVAKVDNLENEVQAMKNERITERTEVGFYKGLIKWFGGVIALMALAYMFNQFFKN